MKTIKKVEVTPEYVEFIPKEMVQGIIYISLEYNTAIHLCLCGCKNQVVTPLNHISIITGSRIMSGWDFYNNNGKVSLSPSIGNYSFDCKSHYILTNNVANFV